MSNLQENKEINQFDELARSLRPHPSKAQILIETIPEHITLEKALGILKSLGIRQLQHEILRKGNPSCILLYLPAEGMSEAVFRLTEAGYVRVKGIGPRTNR